MVTSEEWENLAKGVEAESGEKIEWRTHAEIDDAEERRAEEISAYAPGIMTSTWRRGAFRGMEGEWLDENGTPHKSIRQLTSNP